jgi:nucleotide sugar dehydrogenase
MSIGIIGCGFVGSAIREGFSGYLKKSFDKNPSLGSDSLEEVLKQDFVFIAVPTPMDLSKGGQCDLSILEKSLEDINAIGPTSVLIIKSTVPVGATNYFQEKYPALNLIHSPEFLTAKNAKWDFQHPDRNIVGHSGDIECANKVVKLYKNRFPSIDCLLMESNESEMVKYICNSFLATKVSFFNEMYNFVGKKNCSWDKIISGIISDPRIGNSHYDVPGHDGLRGFGGTCFPKDINSLIHQMKENGLDPKMLKAAWSVNKEVREEEDWLSESSAVSNKNESQD